MKQQMLANIKIAEKADFALLGTLRHQLWPEDTIEAHIKDFTDLAETYGHTAFIAFHEKQAVAFAEVSLRFYANGCLHRPVGFIEGLWCRDEYRHHGLGERLTSRCEDWARDHGAKELATDAYLDNELAHAAYRKWGFEETERVVYFRKTL